MRWACSDAYERLFTDVNFPDSNIVLESNDLLVVFWSIPVGLIIVFKASRKKGRIVRKAGCSPSHSPNN